MVSEGVWEKLPDVVGTGVFVTMTGAGLELYPIIAKTLMSPTKIPMITSTALNADDIPFFA